MGFQGTRPDRRLGYFDFGRLVFGILALAAFCGSMASGASPPAKDAKAGVTPAPKPLAVPQHQRTGRQAVGEPTGESALMRAAIQGNLAAVETVLAVGGDVNLQDRRGRTALAYAIANGHIEVVNVLLTHGAALELADESGATPLMQAIPGAHLKVIEFLIERGANVHVRLTGSKMTPLILAAWYGRGEIINALLDAGADMDATTSGGVSALATSIERRFPAVAKLLLERGANVHGETRTGLSPLDYAASVDDPQTTLAIIERGVDVNRMNRSGMTALMHACMRDAASSAAVLLDAGADPDSTNKSGATALMLAAMNNASGAAAILLQRGALVNARDERTDATALVWAVGGTRPTWPNCLSPTGLTRTWPTMPDEHP